MAYDSVSRRGVVTTGGVVAADCNSNCDCDDGNRCTIGTRADMQSHSWMYRACVVVSW
jgi:hypothetical protein